MYTVTEALQTFGDKEDSDMFMVTWDTDGPVQNSLMQQLSMTKERPYLDKN